MLPDILLPIIGHFDQEHSVLKALEEQLPPLKIQFYSQFEQAKTQLRQLLAAEKNLYVPACILTSESGQVDQMIFSLRELPALIPTRFIVLTTREAHHDIYRCLEEGLLLSVMTIPVRPHSLVRQLAHRICRWSQYHHADAPWDEELRQLWSQVLNRNQSAFAQQLTMSSQDLANQLLASIEGDLGPRPRLNIPAGIDITRQGRPVHGVFLVLSGSVELHHQDEDGGIVLLHHASSGPLIGITSFTTRSLASFTSRTTTPIVAVRITLAQLEGVMERHPDVASLLAMVSMRSLSDRLVRAEQLHIEKERLADELELQSEQALRDSAAKLTDARKNLEEAARFAMLGEMAAGIAHELNNPIAAISRASDQIFTGLKTLLTQLAEDDLPSALELGKHRCWTSTKDTRQTVRQLVSEAKIDRQLARKLAQAGVDNCAQARQLAKDPSALQRFLLASELGASSRDIDLASRRIIGLVKSLRSYARPDDQLVGDVNLHEGIEDVLRLSAPKLSQVAIFRHYAADFPPITCFPPRLEQVWTNIFSNAAEAMEGQTTRKEIHITTSRYGSDQVRVKIEDTGPGIDPHIIEDIFLPQFTTKKGTIHYGLGMGLGISRRIVETHGGKIRAENTERGACMVVTLPINPPTLENQYLQLKEQQ